MGQWPGGHLAPRQRNRAGKTWVESKEHQKDWVLGLGSQAWGEAEGRGSAAAGAGDKGHHALLTGWGIPEGEAAQVPPFRQCSQHWSSSHLSPV